jgi:ADP-ribose pyrophosphatase YjhB (NUDIX family)
MAESKHKGPRLRQVPAGDTHERLVCPDCGFIAYENPRVIVGSVVTLDDRVLLCRRAIEPRRGLWTLPAGFLELGETPEEGARREAWEEARARIAIDALLAVYTIRHIGQIQLMFRAHLTDPAVEAGPESQEVALFRWDAIPRDELAFPSVHWALDQFHEVHGQAAFPPRTNPPGATGHLGAKR